jgi:hypothetical protein
MAGCALEDGHVLLSQEGTQFPQRLQLPLSWLNSPHTDLAPELQLCHHYRPGSTTLPHMSLTPPRSYSSWSCTSMLQSSCSSTSSQRSAQGVTIYRMSTLLATSTRPSLELLWIGTPTTAESLSPFQLLRGITTHPSDGNLGTERLRPDSHAGPIQAKDTSWDGLGLSWHHAPTKSSFTTTGTSTSRSRRVTRLASGTYQCQHTRLLWLWKKSWLSCVHPETLKHP